MFKCFFKIYVQILLVMLFVVPSSAHAYLDPGTSSMILQVLAAGLVSVLAFYSKIKRAIMSFFKKKSE